MPSSVHELIEAQVDRTPDAIAIAFDETQWTYRELDRRANQLAHHLRALGVGRDVRVGICVERSLEMVVALLGVLKAGGAYVPIDPSYPKDRIELMLDDSAAPVVLSESTFRDWGTIAQQSPDRLASTTTADDLAYVIYTSGSTGRPKGVMVSHGGVTNLLLSMAKQPGLGSADILAAVTSLSFDIAGLEIYLPLVTGAKLVVVSRQEAGDGRLLGARLRRCEATVLQATPSTFRLLLDAGWPKPLRVLCGGEALPAALSNRLTRETTEAWNVYGPTETTIWSTMFRLGADLGAPPIGRPIDHTTVYVLDEHLAQTPEPGELYIGGAGLARGYHGRPDLTAERFVPDPFGPAGGRLYRTGDLVKWRSDTLEYLGRLDHQVKVRGFRIELGEIEATLARRAEVREVVVVAREDQAGDQRLVAYLVGARVAVPELRSFLAKTLPDYMIPSAYVWLDAMPLTPNGKLDRKALPVPEAAPERVYHPPQTADEKMLAILWEQVLQAERVGLDDNFFELGGHSLLVANVLAGVRQQTGIALSTMQFFEAPTVRGVALRVADARRAPSRDGRLDSPIEPSPAGEAPASAAQETLWKLAEKYGRHPFTKIRPSYRFTGALDLAVLAETLADLIARHPSLRTRLAMRADGLVQLVDTAPPALEHRDLSALAPHERDREIATLIDSGETRTFDLARGPLWAATLLRLDPAEHLLVLTLDVALADEMGADLLFRDLIAIYRARVEHRPVDLPALAITYGDYAYWQRRDHASGSGERWRQFWTMELAGNPAVALPADVPAPDRVGVAQRSTVLSRRLLDELGRVAGARDATPFMIKLAAFELMVQRWSGHDEMAVGVVSSNRDRPESQRVVGWLARSVVIRGRRVGDPSFSDYVGAVRARALAAYAHSDGPSFIEMEFGSGGQIPYRVMLNSFGGDYSPVELPGLSVLPDFAMHTRMAFQLVLMRVAGGERATAYYDASLFHPQTIDRFLERYARLLEAVAVRPETAISTLVEHAWTP